MNATEIVIGEVQCDSGFQVRQLFAERIRKPRKSAHCHSHRKVAALHKTGGDVLRIGIAHSDLGYNPRDAWWGVPRIGTVELPVIPEHLRELGEVQRPTQSQRHGHCR